MRKISDRGMEQEPGCLFFSMILAPTQDESKKQGFNEMFWATRLPVAEVVLICEVANYVGNILLYSGKP